VGLSAFANAYPHQLSGGSAGSATARTDAAGVRAQAIQG